MVFLKRRNLSALDDYRISALLSMSTPAAALRCAMHRVDMQSKADIIVLKQSKDVRKYFAPSNSISNLFVRVAKNVSSWYNV